MAARSGDAADRSDERELPARAANPVPLLALKALPKVKLLGDGFASPAV